MERPVLRNGAASTQESERPVLRNGAASTQEWKKFLSTGRIVILSTGREAGFTIQPREAGPGYPLVCAI